MKRKIGIILATLVVAGVALLPTASAAAPVRPMVVRIVTISGAGLNDSTITTRVWYINGNPRCAIVTQRTPGQPVLTLADTCPKRRNPPTR